MLKLNKVSVSKGSKNVLHELSLDIPLGRITLFLGKSGSGKTTLLRSIAQLEKNYSGMISYHNKPLPLFSKRSRAQVLSFLPQSFSLFPHMNVLYNCAHPMRNLFNYTAKVSEEKAYELLALLDMERLATSFPHQLSGGQQQRAAIARAIGLNPAFILLDEPTSALDPENTSLFISLLQRLIRENKGVIISSQDMSFAEKVMDLVFFLEGGQLQEVYDSQSDQKLSPQGKIHRFLYGVKGSYEP